MLPSYMPIAHELHTLLSEEITFGVSQSYKEDQNRNERSC